MRFFITSDAHHEARLDDFLDPLYEQGFDEFFSTRDYNDLGTNICVVLMCRDSRLHFSQRIRLSQKDNCLYLDLMFKLEEIEAMTANNKRAFIVRKMLEEIPPIIEKYKKLDFDVLRLSKDIREWFEFHGWIDPDFTVED